MNKYTYVNKYSSNDYSFIVFNSKNFNQLKWPSTENLLKQIGQVLTLGFFYAIKIDEVDTVCTNRGRYALYNVKKQRTFTNNIQS